MADEDATTQSEPAKPTLRIVNPDATPEEIAAVVAVFTALGGGEEPAPRRRAEWGAPHRAASRPLISGADGWRSGSLPADGPFRWIF